MLTEKIKDKIPYSHKNVILDSNQRKESRATLIFEHPHVPISVSIGDTLEHEPTHICKRDPAELIHKFMVELERWARNIQEKVLKDFMPRDIQYIPKKQRTVIEH